MNKLWFVSGLVLGLFAGLGPGVEAARQAIKQRNEALAQTRDELSCEAALLDMEVQFKQFQVSEQPIFKPENLIQARKDN